jgi:hypothetical protein
LANPEQSLLLYFKTFTAKLVYGRIRVVAGSRAHIEIPRTANDGRGDNGKMFGDIEEMRKYWNRFPIQNRHGFGPLSETINNVQSIVSIHFVPVSGRSFTQGS